MHGKPPGYQVLASGSVLGESVSVAPRLDQACALHQRLQPLRKQAAIVAAQVQLAHQLLVSGGVVRLPFNVPQNGLIGKHDFSIRQDKDKA
jgi:hypothetical protein